MLLPPFDAAASGRLLRGNLHAHSTRSDGLLPPGAVCEAYRQQGYDFVAVTDHFLPEYDFPVTDTRPFRRDGFTTLLGAELHAPALANGSLWHIVACGLPPDFARRATGETGQELAARAAAAGAFVTLAHPSWSGATVDDLASVPAAHAVEAHNVVCGVLTDRGDSWFHLDQLLAGGRRVLASVGDDAHFFAPEIDAVGRPGDGAGRAAEFGAWVRVAAGRPEPGAIVAALRAGHYYASQGPEIHAIDLDPVAELLTVRCSPAVSVYLTGNPAGGGIPARHHWRLTGASFTVAPFRGAWCRVTVVDAAGRRAGSNPVWLD